MANFLVSMSDDGRIATIMTPKATLMTVLKDTFHLPLKVLADASLRLTVVEPGQEDRVVTLSEPLDSLLVKRVIVESSPDLQQTYCIREIIFQ